MAAPRTSLSVGDTLSRMEADRRAGDLVVMRRVRDRIDRHFAQPLDVEVVQEPIDQDYGIRDCAVRDPAGNLLRIQGHR
jgi:hypothetical protein